MGLRVVPGPEPVRGARRLALALEIYLAYARVRWLLRGDDARAALARIRRVRRISSPRDEATDTLIAFRLAWAVMRALEPLPADSRCLFRSLTLTWLLERRAIDSQLILSVRPRPFAAHAWVTRGQADLLPPATDGFERLAEL